MYARQQIIKAIIDNGYVYTELTYSRYDFEEAYRFFVQLGNQTIDDTPNGIIATLQLVWRRRYQHSMRGRLVQLIFLVDRLQAYFEQMDTAVFPVEFAGRMNDLKVFFTVFSRNGDGDAYP